MNNLIAKLSNGVVLSQWRKDQTYPADLVTYATGLLLSPYHDGLTVTAAALADSKELESRLQECPAPESDFDLKFHVAAKSAVPGGATMICPNGMTPADLDDSDPVVYRESLA